LIRPSPDLIVKINASLRDPSEFFEDEDELDRVERVLHVLGGTSDPVLLAGLLMSRLARAQAFTEANKRTALAVAHFVLSAIGFDPEAYLPPESTQIRDCLLRAARGEDVEQEVLTVMVGNAETLPVYQEISDLRPERSSAPDGLK
jgi:prophage maintenance system killer protein